MYLEKKIPTERCLRSSSSHILQPVQLHLAPVGARRPACRFPEGYWTSQDRGRQSDLEITFRVLRFWAEISTDANVDVGVGVDVDVNANVNVDVHANGHSGQLVVTPGGFWRLLAVLGKFPKLFPLMYMQMFL